ncbi:MAG: TadE/TadG family type IV pilus assembly protein [Sphingobium sp.]
MEILKAISRKTRRTVACRVLRIGGGLRRDVGGAVLIEAAILLPILILLLVGMVNYGLWFMAAHAVQQAANEGARASLAGIDPAERQSLAGEAVRRSLGAAGSVVNGSLVTTSYSSSGDFYTVTVSYNVARAQFVATSLLPMPPGPIQRASVVKLAAL